MFYCVMSYEKLNVLNNFAKNTYILSVRVILSGKVSFDHKAILQYLFATKYLLV